MDPYNPQDPSEDVFDALAEQLLVTTGAISLIVGSMYEGAANGRLAPDVDVRQSAHELFSSILAENLGALHPEDEIAVAISVLDEALAAICEHIYPVAAGQPSCEGRRRSRGLNSRRP
jgi:hypothetical protein